MTRKDYERAAALVRDIGKRSGITIGDHQKIACETFVTFFTGDNPRFQPGRFREACYRDIPLAVQIRLGLLDVDCLGCAVNPQLGHVCYRTLPNEDKKERAARIRRERATFRRTGKV